MSTSEDKDTRAWSGLCPSGRHGLDYERQRCDLCGPAKATWAQLAARRGYLLTLEGGAEPVRVQLVSMGNAETWRRVGDQWRGAKTDFEMEGES